MGVTLQISRQILLLVNLSNQLQHLEVLLNFLQMCHDFLRTNLLMWSAAVPIEFYLRLLSLVVRVTSRATRLRKMQQSLRRRVGVPPRRR